MILLVVAIIRIKFESRKLAFIVNASAQNPGFFLKITKNKNMAACAAEVLKRVGVGISSLRVQNNGQ